MRFPAPRPSKRAPPRRVAKKVRQPVGLPRLRWPLAGLAWPKFASLGMVRTWLSRHVQTLVGSLGRLASQRVAAAMTMAVIGIALALPASLHLLVTNLQGLSGHWDNTLELSLYLAPDTPEARARAIAQDVAAWPEVAAIELVTADEALVKFREGSGLGDAVDALERNPLPHLVAVRPAAGHDDPDAIDALATRLRGLPEADIVQADTEWMRRLFAMLDMARRLAMLAAGLLAIGVLVIVGNTIRLDIENRRNEIEVMKLIGGTDGFIRRPLLYGGLWYGLGGGLVALAIVQLGLLVLSGPVERLSGLYGSGARLTGPGATGSVVLVLAGAALGWLGSWISATRHLRRIEPGI